MRKESDTVGWCMETYEGMKEEVTKRKSADVVSESSHQSVWWWRNLSSKPSASELDWKWENGKKKKEKHWRSTGLTLIMHKNRTDVTSFYRSTFSVRVYVSVWMIQQRLAKGSEVITLRLVMHLCVCAAFLLVILPFWSLTRWSKGKKGTMEVSERVYFWVWKYTGWK